MICYKCRAEISKDDKFCPQCGVPVKHRAAGNISLVLFCCSFYLLMLAVFFDGVSKSLSNSVLGDPSFESAGEFLASIFAAFFTSAVIILPVMIISLTAFVLGIGCLAAFIIHYACVTAKFKCKQCSKPLAIVFPALSGVFLCYNVIGIAFDDTVIHYIICACLAIPPLVMSVVKTCKSLN